MSTGLKSINDPDPLSRSNKKRQASNADEKRNPRSIIPRVEEHGKRETREKEVTRAIDESERSSRNSRRSNDPALYSSKEREAKQNRYRYAAI